MRKVFVLGSPRSGTTWVAAMLSGSRMNRLVFEPEIHETFAICDREFHAEPLDDAARADFDKVLRNRLEDRRSYRHGVTRFGYHRINWLIRVLVVKFIRCNLAADYLGSRLRGRCVFVLRSPVDTLRSQARVGFGHLPELDTLMANPGVRRFVEEHGYADRELMFSETLALRWVIENIYAVQATDSSLDHLFVEYEQLLDRPDRWRRLLAHLGLSRPSDEQIGRLLSKPSATSFPNRKGIGLSSEDVVAIETLLTAFRFDEFRDAFRRRSLTTLGGN